MTLEKEILGKLDRWANELAAPTPPLRAAPDGDGEVRLEFRQQIPASGMVGKLVRVVSGLRGALLLAEAGHITECAALLRIVSDFCIEISAIGSSLHRSDEMRASVKKFVNQYFMPRARTPDECAARKRMQYVSREKLMRAHEALAEKQPIDMNLLKGSHRFVNMVYDAYVHGAYETTMELWNRRTRSFEMRGHPSPTKREEFVEAVFLKMHEVIQAVELTAAMTSHKEVFEQARQVRRTMDATEPWKYSGAEAPA